MKDIPYPEEIKQEHWERLLRLQEKPLVSIGEIANYLQVSKQLARKTLITYKVPMFYIGRYVAVYPSTLKSCLEGINNTSQITQTTSDDPHR